MPYIVKKRREKIDDWIDVVAGHLQSEGELNYAITRLCYLNRGEGRYADYNRLIGVLECAKLEFYRRVVASYEDEKIEANGDVYHS